MSLAEGKRAVFLGGGLSKRTALTMGAFLFYAFLFAAVLGLLIPALFHVVDASSGLPSAQPFWAQQGAEQEQRVKDDLNKRINAVHGTSPRTLYQAINDAAPDAKTRDVLLAIAIHESDGVYWRFRDVKTDNAYCAFQITPDKNGGANDTVDNAMAYESNSGHGHVYSGRTGGAYPPAQRADYEQLLLADPDVCARAGYATLKQKAGNGDVASPAALCHYGGQPLIGKTLDGRSSGDMGGHCTASIELTVIIALLEGKTVEYVRHDNPDNENYSDVTIKVDGQELPWVLTCMDPSRSLARALANAAKAYQGAALVNARGTWKSSIDAQNNNPTPNPYGDVKKTQCISLINNFFNTIQKFLSDGLGIQQMIISLINNLVNQACQYVANAINSALASVCIPIPKLSLSLSLPSNSTKSCDGLSLLSVVSASANGAASTSGTSSSTPGTVTSSSAPRAPTFSMGGGGAAPFGTLPSGDWILGTSTPPSGGTTTTPSTGQ